MTLEELKQYVDPFDLEKNPAIAVASDGKETNGLTIGWLSYGILWNKPIATAYVHAVRYSKHIFDGAAYYSVNYLPKEYKKQLGYFGSVSGRDEDKMANSGLTVVNDLAPYFQENRVTVICKIVGRSDFDINHVDERVQEWYNRDGVHTQYYGEIVKILVNE